VPKNCRKRKLDWRYAIKGEGIGRQVIAKLPTLLLIDVRDEGGDNKKRLRRLLIPPCIKVGAARAGKESVS